MVITTWPSAAGWSARPPANIKDANPLHTSRFIHDFVMRLVKISRIHLIKLSEDVEVSRNQPAREASHRGEARACRAVGLAEAEAGRAPRLLALIQLMDPINQIVIAGCASHDRVELE